MTQTPAALDQTVAPLFDAMKAWRDQGVHRLFMPGHRGRDDGAIRELLPPEILALDLPSMEATDSPFAPAGCILEAQRLAADAFGAFATEMLVHGSTIGVQASMMTALSPGEGLLLNRAAHMSVFSALVLANVRPRFMPTTCDEVVGPLPTTAAQVEAGLIEHPDVRAVLVTSPTYHGLTADIRAIAEVVHRHGRWLIVDEAHGAHLSFLPDHHPRSALDLGADLVVQSAHKTLTALNGGAYVHVGHEAAPLAPVLRQRLNLLRTTSPSYLVLASLDLARRDVALRGAARFAQAASRAERLRRRMAAIPGLQVLHRDRTPEGCGLDPLKLIVDVAGTGMSGFDLEQAIEHHARVLGEFATTRTLAFALGPSDDEAAYDALVEGISRLAPATHVPVSPPRRDCFESPPMVTDPCAAVYAPKENVARQRAEGRISGERITAYPPGIPLLLPGERITASAIREMESLREHAHYVMAHDRELRQVTVLV
ncbi:MAG: aminotransferase class I/II-fold pyridoxal phosphate-dependent enzyme [Myxococcota bacterium]